MADLKSFFLNAKATIIQYECFTLTHPSITTRNLVRNATRGLTAEAISYTYVPMRITKSESYEHLDQSLKIELGDLGSIIPQSIDAIKTAGTFGTKPTLVYRVYRSDDLSSPVVGPYTLQVHSFHFNDTGCVLEVAAPYLNYSKTGEIYSIDRFPGLAAFR